MSNELPLLIEPAALAASDDRNGLCLISFCERASHEQHGIPGSQRLDYSEIQRKQGQRGGLLPDTADFHALLQRLGIGPETQVVAYDEEGGGYAGRLIWTLHAFGHRKASLLNGGFVAWQQAGLPCSAPQALTPVRSDYAPPLIGDNVIEAEEIMARLGAADFALLDARSADEYSGARAISRRGGHVPGAKHFEWTDAMDRQNGLRLKPAEQLQARLDALGLTRDKEIVVYCQTHHRSALSYVMLKRLGYPRVRGYHGAWSDWGNRDDTPVECG
ncbi:sulfurtransferase [Granulosicoccaceae sp. 1_MG-2023]|nr:sulfurtransferase [Granulosicoccaceae sp. 1_MG-2023]